MLKPHQDTYVKQFPLTRRTLALGALATAATPAFAQTMQPQRLLFIGNSLTYTNNLPRLVEAVFASAGIEAGAEMVAMPGISLFDHWYSPRREAEKAIAKGGWTSVIMQQGPSSQPEGRRDLRGSVKRFAKFITDVGARPGIYCVWPREDRSSDFDDVIESYRLAAEDVDGLFFPVGPAWRMTPDDIRLYSPDGIHPTGYGSYLAALVIYGVLSGKSPIGLPSTLTFKDGARAQIPDDVVAKLQLAAASVL
jgi:hypothetical protein